MRLSFTLSSPSISACVFSLTHTSALYLQSSPLLHFPPSISHPSFGFVLFLFFLSQTLYQPLRCHQIMTQNSISCRVASLMSECTCVCVFFVVFCGGLGGGGVAEVTVVSCLWSHTRSSYSSLRKKRISRHGTVGHQCATTAACVLHWCVDRHVVTATTLSCERHFM